MARPQRSVSTALVVVVAVAGLLAAGRWLGPRIDGRTRAAAPTRPAPTAPATTGPATTSPILAIDRRAGSSGVTRVVATSSQVDAMAVTRRAVWLAVGGLVLRVDPATRRALVVPEVDNGAPVVDLTAGAGAVWAVTSSAGLLRIDPGTRPADRAEPRPGQRHRRRRRGGVWGSVLPGAGAGGGRITRLDPASGRVIANVGLPTRLAVGTGPGAVWVRGAEGWLWRPGTRRMAGRLGRSGCQPSRAGAELAGKVVVAAGRCCGCADGGVAGDGGAPAKPGPRRPGRPEVGATSRSGPGADFEGDQGAPGWLGRGGPRCAGTLAGSARAEP